ncbi:class I adenylate-forming enzyme family protein [Solwaraspora sp. WMMA2065]|nr:class I adenylate-forming enzyme family protein [Solwaraspora sp. WMMA2065]WJK36354.1 class I adenylate-forming enzyme family protein [Solwaraspora sp. WMMA2065]
MAIARLPTYEEFDVTPSQLPAGALLDRFTELAGEHPEHPAFVVADPDGGEVVFSFAELVASAHRFSAHFKDAGIGPGDVVVLAPQNHPCYLSLVLGTWWAGAAVLPISPSFTSDDSALLLDVVATRLGRPVLVDVKPHPQYGTLVLDAGPTAAFTLHGELTPSRRPTVDEGDSYLFMTSGGTTGLPKIMPYPLRWVGNERTPYANAGLGNRTGAATGFRTRLICGSLHHTGNFTVAIHVLLTGSSVIIMTRFDATLACELLRRHEVYSLGLTPYYMMLILGLPDLDRSVFDGVARITHGAAPCPHWIKQAWIESMCRLGCNPALLVGVPQRVIQHLEIPLSELVGIRNRREIVQLDAWTDETLMLRHLVPEYLAAGKVTDIPHVVLRDVPPGPFGRQPPNPGAVLLRRLVRRDPVHPIRTMVEGKVALDRPKPLELRKEERCRDRVGADLLGSLLEGAEDEVALGNELPEGLHRQVAGEQCAEEPPAP